MTRSTDPAAPDAGAERAAAHGIASPAARSANPSRRADRPGEPAPIEDETHLGRIAVMLLAMLLIDLAMWAACEGLR